MAAFASIIGGMGNAAGEYGQQIRGILEKRRGDLANMMTQVASQESDPQLRAQYLSHASDLLSGKDMSKIGPAVVKTIQGHMQGNEALAQAIGGPPSQPQRTPANVVGSTPGTGSVDQAPTYPVQPGGPLGPPPIPGGVAAQPSSSTGIGPGAAAQPPTSLVQSQSAHAPAPSQTIPPATPAIPPVAAQTPQASGLPEIKVQDPSEIVNKYMSNPMWAAPANRAALQKAMDQELSHNEALRQTLEQSQATLQVGLQRLGMMNDPRVKAYADQLKASGYPEALIPSLVGSALGIQMPPMAGLMGTMFTPVRMPGLTADQVIHNWPDEAKAAGIQPGNSPVDVLVSKVTGRPVQIGAHSFRSQMEQGINVDTGAPQEVQVNPFNIGPVGQQGNVMPMPSSALSPTIRGINPVTGEQGATSAARLGLKFPPLYTGLISPSELGRSTTSSTQQLESGGSRVQRIVQPVLPGASAPVAGGAPNPSSATTTATRLAPAIAPFNPSDKTDNLVMQIANGDMHIANVGNQATKDHVERRMAELGIQQGNVTGSMRDRAATAKLVLGHMNTIDGIIDKAESDGDLGLVATNWNKFILGTLKTDPTKSQVFSKLTTHLGFLQTAVAMAHGGLRAGGSPQMVEHWQDALMANTPGTLRAKLSVAKDWMQGYSTLDKALKTVPGIPGAEGQAAPKTYQHYANGPGGRIGSNDLSTWYNVQTGQPVK